MAHAGSLETAGPPTAADCEWLDPTVFGRQSAAGDWPLADLPSRASEPAPAARPRRSSAPLLPVAVLSLFLGLTLGRLSAPRPEPLAYAAPAAAPAPEDPASRHETEALRQKLELTQMRYLVLKEELSSLRKRTPVPSLPLPLGAERQEPARQIGWVSLEGDRFKLAERGLWETSPGDCATVANWNREQAVTLSRNGPPQWPYLAINNERLESAFVRPAR